MEPPVPFPARGNIQIPEENRFSYRDKSSLQLHRDRNILRSRKINSTVPIPCNPQEFISLFLPVPVRTCTSPRPLFHIILQHVIRCLSFSLSRLVFLFPAYLSRPSRPSPEDRFSSQSVANPPYVLLATRRPLYLAAEATARGSAGRVSYL